VVGVGRGVSAILTDKSVGADCLVNPVLYKLHNEIQNYFSARRNEAEKLHVTAAVK
jgi:hypothetical protein